MLAVRVMGNSAGRYLRGFLAIFVLSVLAYAIAQQTTIRAAGLGYAFWALGIGLAIANSIGTPAWIKPALRSELYIKAGLVLLGAEILFGNIMRLGVPGLFVAWVVTPTVIVFMYQLGTRVFKIRSRALVVVIAAATSVCGVSAAIAAAAASRAKKEELTLAVGMSLIFTVLMMVAMPLGIRAVGMDPVVGAAWIGGTVDATGAVVAAGAILGEQAEQIAAVVKMIQNTLIGVVAFLIAVYWVTRVEAREDRSTPNAMEVWYRFPKFILGFFAASVLFSFVLTPALGAARVEFAARRHIRFSRMAVLPGVRQHRARIELSGARPSADRRKAYPALRGWPDIQRGADPARCLSGVRRHPLRSHPVRSHPGNHRPSRARQCHPQQCRERPRCHRTVLYGGRGMGGGVVGRGEGGAEFSIQKSAGRIRAEGPSGTFLEAPISPSVSCP